jgi:hypothetical protein
VRSFSGNAKLDKIGYFVDQRKDSLIINSMPDGNDYELIDNAYGQTYPALTAG